MIEVYYPPYFGHGMLDIQVPSILFLKYFIRFPFVSYYCVRVNEVLGITGMRNGRDEMRMRNDEPILTPHYSHLTPF